MLKQINQENFFTHYEIGKIAQRSLLVRLKLAQDKELVSWQTISNAIILYESTPADCSFNVVRRNLDDTEAEILCESKLPERQEALRMKSHDATRQEPAQGNLMRERAASRLTPRNEQISIHSRMPIISITGLARRRIQCDEKTLQTSMRSLEMQTGSGVIISATRAKVHLQEFGTSPFVKVCERFHVSALQKNSKVGQFLR